MYKTHSLNTGSRQNSYMASVDPAPSSFASSLVADFEDISLRDSIQTVSTAPTSPSHSSSDSGSSKSRSSSSSLASHSASAPTSSNASSTALDTTLRPSEDESNNDHRLDDSQQHQRTSQEQAPPPLKRQDTVRLNSYAMKSLKSQPSLSLMREPRNQQQQSVGLGLSFSNDKPKNPQNHNNNQQQPPQRNRMVKRNSADSYLTMATSTSSAGPSPNGRGSSPGSSARHRMSAPLSSSPLSPTPHGQLPRKNMNRPLLQRALSSNHLPRMDQRLSLSPRLRQKQAAFDTMQGVPDLSQIKQQLKQQHQKQKPRPSRRLSAEELEMKYEMDDTDDYDLPDDACMFNVPLSPALFAKQSQSSGAKSTPNLTSSSSVSSLRTSSSTTIAASPLTLNLNSTTSPSVSVSSFKNQARSRSFGSSGSPVSSSSTRSSYASDMLSSPLPSIYESEQMRVFDEFPVMNDLSYEAKILTHKLRDLPEPMAPRTPPSANSNRNSTASLSSSNCRASGGLSKSCSMDTLESSSPSIGTRPSWLPPKTAEEEQKHLEQYQKLIEKTASSDKKKKEEERRKLQQKQKQHQKDESDWLSKILVLSPSDYNKYYEKHYSEMREMWWRGLPLKHREAIWSKAIGNELGITAKTYDDCLSKCNRDKYLEIIEKDVTYHAFPDLKIFDKQSGPLHNDLVNILLAVTSYEHPSLSKLGQYATGLDIVGAAFLLNMQPLQAFIALVNFIVKMDDGQTNQNGILMALLSKDEASLAVYHSSALKVLNMKVPELYKHFQKTRIAPGSYLDPLIRDVFSRNLSLDIVNRIFDIMVFEGDNILLRAALGVIVSLEPHLYGTSDDIKSLVGWNSKMLSVPPEDKFIDAVREVLRNKSP